MVENDRFQFGRNWQIYLKENSLKGLDLSIQSIKAMLSLDNLSGKSFLDIGSGSGLSSLAAHRLGAKVHSFDYDLQSVECTKQLSLSENSEDWTLQQGSVLDSEFMDSLGQFDIVYSWGALHHTGEMWSALNASMNRVANDGLFFVALYNKHWTSPLWWWIKKAYVLSPSFVQSVFYLFFRIVITLKLRLSGARTTDLDRGMILKTDIIDWIGGFPYEYASTDDVIKFAHKKGFVLEKQSPCSGWTGCNEFVFRKRSIHK